MSYVEAVLTILHTSALKITIEMYAKTMEHLQHQCDYALKAKVTYSQLSVSDPLPNNSRDGISLGLGI
jgi:hypothetical protein